MSPSKAASASAPRSRWSFPLPSPSSIKPSTPPKEWQPPEPTRMPDRPPRILHVDDDEANRYAVTRSLVKAGYEVAEAATGSDALREVDDLPDLVILDVRLPDIDGY